MKSHAHTSGCAAALLATALLAACGGSDTDGSQPTDAYIQAVAAADAKEAQARTLGVTNPCTAVQQCAHLEFAPTGSGCGQPRFKPYSLVASSAAAASAAAAEHASLAAQARALAPKSDLVCPAVVATPPALACTASQCQDVTP